MSFLADLAKGGVEGVGAAFRNVVAAFKADPTKVVELEAAAEKMQLDYQALVMQAVNTTMQAEARSEHWMQWSWRPVVGFTFALTIINNYVVYPYLGKFGMLQVVIPTEVWMAMLTVLGVAAWTRGQEKVSASISK